VTKKLIASEKEVERQKSGDILINNYICQIVKQMFKENKDVVCAGWMKDVDGAIVVVDERIMEVLKRYNEKLMNEEFDWDKDNLEGVKLVSGPRELVSTSKIGTVIAKSKSGKSTGPSGVVVEI